MAKGKPKGKAKAKKTGILTRKNILIGGAALCVLLIIAGIIYFGGKKQQVN